jgi:hypothetical protein
MLVKFKKYDLRQMQKRTLISGWREDAKMTHFDAILRRKVLVFISYH